MVRIGNKEIPENKNIWVALSYIHGFGKKFGPTSPSRRILAELNINPLVKVRDLTSEQISQISQKAKEFPTEGVLKEQVQKNINEQINLGTYQGLRRSRKPNPLPVHGNYYIIADHLRTTIFALADGATFEPKGRGYILKKLVKKATLLAYLLGLSTEQLIEVSKKLIAVNSSYYQHLKKREDLIINELKKEIVKTREFIDKSIQELGKYYEPSITAKDIFFWYDTKGIPEELIRFFLAKNNYQFPEREFNQLLEKQKERGRQDRAGKKVAVF
ncbi:19233_t:CDS:2 [Racocetra fulgida]|uniref:19233_t:CDS:1 n=1 Tax=Racocetra fulgida TaxID=60492 RepID=A0A9N8VFU9_9GLOM|nr:19233_t:CDS:2 [Racocetra fulgida]